MSPWSRGSNKIDALIEKGGLHRLTGADVGVEALMERAHQMLTTARSVVHHDPVTAYTVAYDAAKHAGSALLAEQNLRSSDHVTIERALEAQFAGVFSKYGHLRRRRNELDYPVSGEDFADAREAEKAIEDASQIVEHAAQILEQGVLTTY